jgi:hypothetical protein
MTVGEASKTTIRIAVIALNEAYRIDPLLRICGFCR